MIIVIIVIIIAIIPVLRARVLPRVYVCVMRVSPCRTYIYVYTCVYTCYLTD